VDPRSTEPASTGGAPATARWTAGNALLGLLAAELVSAVATGLYAGVTGDRELTFGLFLAGSIGLWSGFVGVAVVLSRQRGSGSVVRDTGLRLVGRDVLVGIPIGLVCQLVLVPLLYLPMRGLVDVDELDDPAHKLSDAASGGLRLTVLVLVIVVGAAVVEELFFRGVLLPALARRLGDGWGLAVSSVVFGLAHFELVALPGLVAVGVVFAVLKVRTGRLGPGIAAHMAFNAVVAASLVASR
jgi:membrane protease YdiL (CAAX protease family)